MLCYDTACMIAVLICNAANGVYIQYLYIERNVTLNIVLILYIGKEGDSTPVRVAMR